VAAATCYDASLPGEGLVILHVDEKQPDNTDESHYMVGLVQADNQRDLEWSANRGDPGDSYPGSTANTSFSPTSTPNSHSYAGAPTGVSITGISASAPTMTATVAVSAPGPVHVPVGAAAARAKMDGEVGLAELIPALHARLEALEQVVAGDARRSAEPVLDGGQRPARTGAPDGLESAVGVGHAYRRP
jgi:immune inhibitor A